MAELERRAKRDTTRDAPIETALDWVCNYVESGETLRALAKELDVTSGTLRLALERRFGRAEVKTRIAAARIEGGHSMNDKAIERSQNISDKEDAAGARVEVGAYQFTAKTWNREQYGDRQTNAVQVNLGLPALHLDALRRRAAADRAALPVLPAEVISITDGESSVPPADAPAGVFPSAPESPIRADTLVRDET